MDEPEPELHGAVLLVCRSLWYDHRYPERGYGLAGMLTHFESPDGSDFPQRVERMFVYAQLWGTPGEYRLWVRLVRVDKVGYDEEVEVQLGAGGQPRNFPMPTSRPMEISGLNFIDEVAFPIESVPFGDVGVYEFQLWSDVSAEAIARYRIQARR